MLERTGRRAPRRTGRRGDRGASAVEFALVAPLLFTLVFAGVDYGLFFADSLSVYQGVADAARAATLNVGTSGPNWPGSGSCGLTTTTLDPLATGDLAKVACQLQSDVTPIAGGSLQVKAEIVDGSGTPTAQWVPGRQLRVCAQTQHSSILPFVPLPAGGLLTSRVDMPIQPGPTSLLLNPVFTPGPDWSWC